MDDKKSDRATYCRNRRRLNQIIGAGAIAIPVSVLKDALNNFALASETVDPDSPQANALRYNPLSETAGQLCGNCSLFQGDQDQETGPCPLFSGNLVSKAGWCSAWVPNG